MLRMEQPTASIALSAYEQAGERLVSKIQSHERDRIYNELYELAIQYPEHKEFASLVAAIIYPPRSYSADIPA